MLSSQTLKQVFKYCTTPNHMSQMEIIIKNEMCRKKQEQSVENKLDEMINTVMKKYYFNKNI